MKCNLDVVWHLPTTSGQLVNFRGDHCAWGKIIAGCLGRPLVYGVDDALLPGPQTKVDRIRNAIVRKLAFCESCESIPYVDNFGNMLKVSKWEHVWRVNDEGNYEQAIRLGLEYCMEAGLIELEDSDIALVKELREKYNNGKSESKEVGNTKSRIAQVIARALPSCLFSGTR